MEECETEHQCRVLLASMLMLITSSLILFENAQQQFCRMEYLFV